MAKVSPLQTQEGVQDSASLDHIYDDPSTVHALELFERFAKRSLAGEGLQAYLDTLPADAAPERAKLEGLLSGTESNAQIDLSSRSNQLVWAAGLGHVFQTNPPKFARSHPIWRAITDNPQVQGSLSSAARFIDLSVTNRNATMDWGTPGSWFWFSPDKNHVNIDLFNTLLTGFADDPAPGIKGMAHTSGVMMHEVGHSQLTTRFTDKMMELKTREEELVEASEERKLTQDEFKELTRVRTEFGMRMNVMNAAEDNCVNQYAANHGREMPHDFSASLNVCNVVLQGTGHILKTPPENSDANDAVSQAQKSFADLNKAIALSFYATNGLFDRGDIETWKRLGIDPDAIKASDTASGQSAADHFLNTGKSDFERLLDLNVGASGMAGQQPQIRDRQLLRSIFARSIETYADRRCRIVDEIWDKYAAQYADVILDAAEQDAQNRMDQKQQENAQNGQQQDGQEQGDGQDNSQDDQQNDGQGQSSEGQSSQGQPDANQSGDGQGSSSSQDQSGEDASPSQGSGSGPGSPSQNQDQSQDGNGGGNTQENQAGGEEQDQSNSGGGTGQDMESENNQPSNTVDVEGVGEMELDGGDSEGKPLPCTPEEARQQQREAAEAQIYPQDAQTVRDLAREAKRQERQANPANNNGQGNQGQNNGSDPSKKDPKDDLNMGSDDAQGGRDRGVDLENLARAANWQDWKLETGKLEPVIRRVADDFNYIRDRQKQKERSLSKRRETLPRGNNLRERLDMPAHMRLAVKRATGQRIEEPDLRRWKMDEVKMTPTSVELWILTDGSQSMTWDRRGRPIDAAVQSMAILYEAGRRADFDVFAGMWGDEKLRLLAQPGERDQNIGKNFQAAKNGIDSYIGTPAPLARMTTIDGHEIDYSK